METFKEKDVLNARSSDKQEKTWFISLATISEIEKASCS